MKRIICIEIRFDDGREGHRASRECVCTEVLPRAGVVLVVDRNRSVAYARALEAAAHQRDRSRERRELECRSVNGR
jgi:hypothetical protein